MTDLLTATEPEFALASALERWCALANAAIAERLAQHDARTAQLVDAMHYAVSNGGKRMRPALVYATGDSFGANPLALDAPAAAIEMIHAYSLVHDDLPAMDDDDLRRGQPTVHIKFDEATAILAGDALQTNAFTALATDSHNSDSTRLAMIACLAQHSGVDGMAGGQAIDLAAVERQLTLQELQHMHRKKTGGLITAAVSLGALAAGVDGATRATLRRYSDALGLAFQIADDILDVTADTQTLGKRQGADAAQGKPTYCSLLGVDGARAEAAAAHSAAHEALDALERPVPALRALADFSVTRTH